MFRFIIGTILLLFVMSVVRMIMNTVMQGFSEAMKGSQPSPSPGPQQAPPGQAAGGGTLKRDPVCGTYVPESTSLRKTARSGEVVCFCSTTCRDKFAG